MAMGLMWLFYNKVGDDSKGFYSKSGLILNVLGLAYGAGAWVTISLCMSFTRSFEYLLKFNTDLNYFDCYSF